MALTSSIKRDYLYNLAKNGKRADERKFDEFRNIEIETGFISKAEGSARVKIGNTQVIAGIKMDIGDPYSDSPDKGVMITAAELIPLASPDFESGPPREDAIELARVVDRGIRESEVIGLDKLCIESGEKIWLVFIDIHIIDFDGNLFDAASLAALAALYNTKIPLSKLTGENKEQYLKNIFKDKNQELLNFGERYGNDISIPYEKAYEIPGVDEVIRRKEETEKKTDKIKISFDDAELSNISNISNYDDFKLNDIPLPMNEPPISCTSVKFNDVIVLDPSLDEEEIAEARLTVATDKNGDIRAMQKGLSGSFTVEEIKKVIKASIDNGAKIREELYKSAGK